jgi:hypothetical protein
MVNLMKVSAKGRLCIPSGSEVHVLGGSTSRWEDIFTEVHFIYF